MRSNNALASPTFLQALSSSERRNLLKQLSGSARRQADVAVGGGGQARAIDARTKQTKASGSLGSAIAHHPDLADVHGLLQELNEYKAALRSMRAEADGLIRDNRELSTEVVQLRKLAASERENSSALDNRVAHLQALYVDSFEKQNSLHFKHQASLNAKLDQLATPEVLAATQPPAEFPVPAPHSEPKGLGSAVTEINKLRKQLVHAQTWLVKADKHCAHYQQRLSESQSHRKAEKAGYQREMAGMQSRLLGAMRRLVYVADKVAVKEAAIAERDAYVNRLEQQLVTKSGPPKRPPCKGHKHVVETGRRRQNRPCQSSGPAARSPSRSPAARTQRTSLISASSPATERGPVSSSLAVAPRGTLHRPASAQAAGSEVAGYRQKHELQSRARVIRQASPQVKASWAIQDEGEVTGSLAKGRFAAHSLLAATSIEPYIVAADGSVSPQSDIAGGVSPGPDSSFDEHAWDAYQDALDAMQRRIDAMGPMLDAYDAPSIDGDAAQIQVEMDTDMSILDNSVLQDPKHEL